MYALVWGDVKARDMHTTIATCANSQQRDLLSHELELTGCSGGGAGGALALLAWKTTGRGMGMARGMGMGVGE
jgi:hypothetical protein